MESRSDRRLVDPIRLQLPSKCFGALLQENVRPPHRGSVDSCQEQSHPQHTSVWQHHYMFYMRHERMCCKAPWTWEEREVGCVTGVALGYSQLPDAEIRSLPIPKLQSNGFLFIWVINAKFTFTLDLFRKWGYQCAPCSLIPPPPCSPSFSTPP